MKNIELKTFLDQKSKEFNHPRFIENDPISIPKKFTKLQDVEIIGLWTALLSWGQRVTIINNANRIVEMMDGTPFDFVKNLKLQSFASILSAFFCFFWFIIV